MAEPQHRSGDMYAAAFRHAEVLTFGLEALSERDQVRLRGTYFFLRGRVIEHDPRRPELPRLRVPAGWRYLPQGAEDGQILIRVNPNIRLTTVAGPLWVLPIDSSRRY
ncbi:hypothetical protein [Nocardia sp. CA-119907]|uniref:hypothetical protein n=1 Tax=Nocardia sp. CA-119907 TaxID=3239973 RepID=UPI003D96893C